MRIVIQNWITKQFLTDTASWTPVLAQAKIFTTSFDAYHYCEEHAVPNSQVVLKFDRSKEHASQPVGSF
jgi:hypothetical protein